ncbi:hypothetical protein BDV33DRAFT_200546 [Aspergillus novoparasiticus]|uniref:Uncharacterized protein n=1 Tax=Aspergillus novoparasiticus TaxID=986946 RepID=A0A5N6F429_9EURO|nr:hypothetical protein BDV33DRAFT_200546 [Aspergillus novoparasiticus]
MPPQTPQIIPPGKGNIYSFGEPPVHRANLSVMRKDGSYGNVLSIVFHDPRTAEHFYNAFNVCKGSSFGTNFTLAIPVGLEDSRQIVETVKRALKCVDGFEMKKDLD